MQNGHDSQADVIVPKDWVDLQGPLEAALAASGGRYTPRDVFDQVVNQRAQWWPGEASVVVTRMYEDGKDLVLHFWLAGGELEEIQLMERYIAERAQAELNATVARISGRKGWLTALPGYKETSVTMERRLGGDDG